MLVASSNRLLRARDGQGHVFCNCDRVILCTEVPFQRFPSRPSDLPIRQEVSSASRFGVFRASVHISGRETESASLCSVLLDGDQVFCAYYRVFRRQDLSAQGFQRLLRCHGSAAKHVSFFGLPLRSAEKYFFLSAKGPRDCQCHVFSVGRFTPLFSEQPCQRKICRARDLLVRFQACPAGRFYLQSDPIFSGGREATGPSLCAVFGNQFQMSSVHHRRFRRDALSTERFQRCLRGNGRLIANASNDLGSFLQ